MEHDPVTGRKEARPGEGKDPIGRTAIRAFAAGASILFAGALYYCYTTGHYLALGMLSTVFVLGVILVISVYRSMYNEREKDQSLTEIERRNMGAPKRHAHGGV